MHGMDAGMHLSWIYVCPYLHQIWNCMSVWIKEMCRNKLILGRDQMILYLDQHFYLTPKWSTYEKSHDEYVIYSIFVEIFLMEIHGVISF